jgi:hypothetical protein
MLRSVAGLVVPNVSKASKRRESVSHPRKPESSHNTACILLRCPFCYHDLFVNVRVNNNIFTISIMN